jgi:hypothetical protein
MKRQNLTLSIALATIFSSSVVFAETEVTGKIVLEAAGYTTDGEVIGAATATNTTALHSAGDMFKAAGTAKIFIDGDIPEVAEIGGGSYHIELQGFADGESLSSYDSNEDYTQRDVLREAYIDTEAQDVAFRIGKQQVVWGTADGMKLLDAINPTDYTEMAQNQMEDSRIPVWMINAESDLAAGGSVQVVISEAKGSVFAGLGTKSAASTSNHSADNGDVGHAFKMKGVDSITGRTNGFLNLAPALGKVAKFAFGGDHTAGSTTGALEAGFSGAGLTVYDYVNANAKNQFGANTSWVGLCGAANGNGQNNEVTNLCNTAGGTEKVPDNMFEFMTATSFATFDTLSQISSEYRVEHTDGSDANVSLRYKNATNNGVNYSLNYMNGHDTNPSVDMHWEQSSGEKLYVGTTTSASTGNYSNVAGDDMGSTEVVTTVRLYKTEADAAADTNRWNSNTVNNNDGDTDGPANLVFVESLNKIQQFGGSFDTAIETTTLGPVVIRGEALYQKDVESPVIDRQKLGHGDLVGGLTMVKGDMFKYVIGADITVLTNMMISAQFIQEMNLDYINETRALNKEYTVNQDRYTADRAAMSMSNNLQRAEENKEFYSLFLSKPFGASGEHRWNNIFMFEENGGMWNRLDAEFSVDDDTQATIEWNNYFGDKNTQFGQLAESSNIQVGVKYSF